MIKDKGGQDGESVRMGVFFLDAGCRMLEERDKRQAGRWVWDKGKLSG
jgi:hypothetical protein